MKKIQLCGMMVSALMALLVAASAQAAILWGPATTISADTDISTNGALVVAYNLGNSTPGTTTINGVPFVNDFGTGAGFTVGASPGFNGAHPSAFGSANAPFNGLSANYKSILAAAIYRNDTAPFTLTLSGLTVGHPYEFQWWADDSRANRLGWTTTATDGGSVALSLNTSLTAADGGVGQFAIGTFTATGSTEVISFAGNVVGNAVVNAYQLRDLAVPEPSIALLFISGGLMLRYARRRKN